MTDATAALGGTNGSTDVGDHSLNTGYIADDDCKRAIALGVRPDGQTANDEQWQTLRAIAIDALFKQQRANNTRVASGHPALSAAEVAEASYDECRTELQRIVTLSYRSAQQREQLNLARPHNVAKDKTSRPVDAWHAAWVAWVPDHRERVACAGAATRHASAGAPRRDL